MPAAYINYYKKSLDIIEGLEKGTKPRLLFHVCCAPCAAFPLLFLAPHFEVTIYYGNSNIYPEAEYVKRLNELKKYLAYIKRDYGFDFPLIEPPYDYDEYMEDLRPLKDEPEGGKRCRLCYYKRMEEAYAYAEKNGYDYFCTVMSISRQKDAAVLNAIGSELSFKHPSTKYFYSDFKKNQGDDLARDLQIHYGLYRQDYCGCEYSLAARERQKAEKIKNWEG